MNMEGVPPPDPWAIVILVIMMFLLMVVLAAFGFAIGEALRLFLEMYIIL